MGRATVSVSVNSIADARSDVQIYLGKLTLHYVPMRQCRSWCVPISPLCGGLRANFMLPPLGDIICIIPLWAELLAAPGRSMLGA